MYAVIMAGGRGTRFWPYSRQNRPKQLLKIIGQETMLQMTVDRLKKLRSIEDIFIITGPELAPIITKEIEGVRKNNIIVEPSGKNTAPCIGLAALKMSEMNQDAVMGVFPADHLIVGFRPFQKAISHAKRLALKNQSLVTIGIKPTYPSTGYGYIQFDPKKPVNQINGYKVKTFAEKPHLSLARRFLRSGDFLWNGGMFVWQVSAFLNQLNDHMPELSEFLGQIREAQGSKKGSFSHIWEKISPESIDYGLMEKADNIYVIEAEFEWSDVGSWESVYELSSKAKDGNVIRGDGAVIGGKNNLLESNGRFTALIGVDELVVINTEDATLVVPRGRVEEVKTLVEFLKKGEREELL